MSMSRTMLLAIPLAVACFMTLLEATGSAIVAGAAGGVGALAAVMIVWYSPYPDSTHNFGAGVPRQQWGFTSEQDGDKWIIEPQNGGKQ